MDEIIDGNKKSPATDCRITTQLIKVRMLGLHGFKAVTEGNERHGKALITGNLYNIDLPGLTAGKLDVEFRRN